jgi:hypothetical protein
MDFEKPEGQIKVRSVDTLIEDGVEKLAWKRILKINLNYYSRC